MNEYLKISVLIIIMLIYSCGLIYSQSQQYNFRHLTTKEGLPANAVNSIIKGSDGFMWFGTDNGLARFDGYNVKTYQIQGDSIINSDDQKITKIFEDNEGNLWIGTAQQGLQLFDRMNETFVGFMHDPGKPNSLSSNSVYEIYQDKDGNLWIGTKFGLNKFDPSRKEFIVYHQESQKPDNPKDKVFAIFGNKSGRFWIGTDDGIFLFDRQNEIFSKLVLSNEIPGKDYRRVNCIVEDRNGIIWIGTDWGMFRYDPATEEIVNYLPASLKSAVPRMIDTSSFVRNIYFETFNLFVQSIVETKPDGDDLLWIATRWGLNKFDINQGNIETFYPLRDNPRSISTSNHRTLFLDEDGLLWIATSTSGVEILNIRSNPFHDVFIKVPGENYSYQATSIFLDQDKNLWIGGVDAGLFHYDKDFNLIGNYKKWNLGENAFDERQHNRINCIYEDPGGILWLGYYKWGLVNFDREQKSFRQIELHKGSGVQESDFINNILQDRYGFLWVGTNAGLYLKNNNQGIHHSVNNIQHNELCKSDILRIFEDKKSNLWISTRNNGIYCLTPDERMSMRFVHYLDDQQDQNGFSGKLVSSIYEDRNGTLWFGSDKGLYRFNFLNSKFEPEKDFNADYGGYIIRIYGDDRDNLWIFHSMKGLLRYQPNSNNRTKVKVFDIGDGLPFDNYNTQYSFTNTFYQSRDGRLFMSGSIGTENSLFWFHPDSIKEVERIPLVVITDFTVGNQNLVLDSSINLKKHITLDYKQNFFSFEFTALDFLMPEKNQYAYRLEGFEDGWINSGNRRMANYTGVPPGEYTFRVKGSNHDGSWNEEGTFVYISILPPFWKTWWAYTVYILAILAVIYFIIQFYLRRQRLLNNLALEKIKTENLKELDGLKTKFFTNISHEFRTPLTLILGPLQKLRSGIENQSDKQVLSMVIQNAHRLKELINQLLSLSKLESGKMKLQAEERDAIPLIRGYVQSFESLARQKGIELAFISEKDGIPVWVDKEKLEQVLNNLISNAFKFTDEGGRIEVSVSRSTGLQVLRSSGDSQPASLPTCQPADPPTRQPKKPGDHITIKISDTGLGIPQEKLPQIFDRFFQVDDSMSREQEGTGIGLAIVKEMVTLHHGEIDVESEVGVGSTFRIYLPLGREHLIPEELMNEGAKIGNLSRELGDWQLAIPSEQDLHKAPIGSVMKKIDSGTQNPELRTENSELRTEDDLPILLIVEDNPDMRTFIRGYFEYTYKVFEAENGKKGLNLATNMIPDIIISDVMMPGMDGYEFCQKIKTDERTSHIPVILLTARASKESRLEGLETGADDFITKPFDGEELEVRVKNLIDQRKKLSEHYLREFDFIRENRKEKIFSMEEKFLQKARLTVEKNRSDPDYSVENLASDMAMSRSQLHRKLSALVNQTTTEFIRTIRLNYAVGLLKKRAGTISEIAYDAGFNNPTYFSISFKKHFGISPTEYLNQLDM